MAFADSDAQMYIVILIEALQAVNSPSEWPKHGSRPAPRLPPGQVYILIRKLYFPPPLYPKTIIFHISRHVFHLLSRQKSIYGKYPPLGGWGEGISEYQPMSLGGKNMKRLKERWQMLNKKK